MAKKAKRNGNSGGSRHNGADVPQPAHPNGHADIQLPNGSNPHLGKYTRPSTSQLLRDLGRTRRNKPKGWELITAAMVAELEGRGVSKRLYIAHLP